MRIPIVLGICLVGLVATPLAAQSRPAAASPSQLFVGDVLDPDGKPAAGAVIHVLRKRLHGLPQSLGASLPDFGAWDELTVTADAGGRFRVELAPSILHAAYAQLGELMSPALPSLVAGDIATLRLATAQKLAAQVVAQDPGAEPRPVAGAVVRVTSSGFGLETRTAGDGRFELLLPPQSPGLVQARLAGRASLAVSTHAVGTIVKTLSLFALRTAHGVLVDAETAAPVAGAIVQWAWPPQTAQPVVSDEKGRFELLLPVDYPATLHIVPLHHERAVVEVTAGAAGPDAPLRIRMKEGLRLTARLLQSDGTPAAGTRVLLEGPVGERGAGPHGPLEWTQVTDATGRLLVGCLQESARLNVFAESGGTFLRVFGGELDGNKELGDVRLALDGRIHGSLTAADGTPVASAIVRVQPGGEQPEPGFFHDPGLELRAVRTNATGKFMVTGLQPGPYRIAAVTPALGLVVTDARASAASPPLALTLPAGQKVSGVLLTPDGKPWAGHGVVLHSQDAYRDVAPDFPSIALFHAKCDDAGRFVFAGLPAGSAWTVSTSGWWNGKTVQAPQQEVEAGTSGVRLAPVDVTELFK